MWNHSKLAATSLFLAGCGEPAPGSSDSAAMDPADAAQRNVEYVQLDGTWHANFDAACEAASQSKKPVLLFSLFGHLDRERC